MSETQQFIQTYIIGFTVTDMTFVVMAIATALIVWIVICGWLRSLPAASLCGGVSGMAILMGTLPRCVYAGDCLFDLPLIGQIVLTFLPAAIGFALACLFIAARGPLPEYEEEG